MGALKIPQTLKPRHAATRSALKAMSIFGGVRALAILCSLIRNKLIAIWVGPVGVGLVILYNSIIDLVAQVTRLSIDQSAVRDISATTDPGQLPRTVSTVTWWTWALGIAGALTMCLLSPLLSQWSFGTTDRWWTFCVLSAVPLCITVSGGIQAIMQGTRQFGRMAKVGTLSTLAGIAATVPLVYTLRRDSIVWIILAYGLAALVTALLVWRPGPRIKMPLQQIWQTGKSFIRLGALITAGLAVGQLFTYLFVLFLNSYASTDTLGLYQAGYTLINTYAGILFTGIWVEYFPRLSANSHSQRRTAVTVAHQTMLSIWVLTPVIAIFIAADSLIVQLLYSQKFTAILPYITIGIIGTLPRAISWCLATVILARGDGRCYVITETVSSAIFLALHITFYSAWGFSGIGVAYLLWFTAYVAITATVYSQRYHLTLPRHVWLAGAAALAFALVCLLAKSIAGWWLPLLLGLAVTPLSLKHLLGRK